MAAFLWSHAGVFLYDVVLDNLNRLWPHGRHGLVYINLFKFQSHMTLKKKNWGGKGCAYLILKENPACWLDECWCSWPLHFDWMNVDAADLLVGSGTSRHGPVQSGATHLHTGTALLSGQAVRLLLSRWHPVKVSHSWLLSDNDYYHADILST